ncbi:prepilin-type N-terminal cleavage/methylation domain-containing protein [Lutibacter sp. B2]|nr:prepilin-type N-terminal cleavage/methylation domain-containing protein [Lutibacter sp. B2]
MFKQNNKKGFTIIELLITVAILGIIASLSIPKIDHTNLHLKTQGRLLCSDLRAMRLASMTEGEGYMLYLRKNYYVINNGLRRIKKVTFVPNYEVLPGKQRIMFNYNGSPSYGGMTIKIINRKTKKYIEITIVPASGRILLKDEIHEF